MRYSNHDEKTPEDGTRRPSYSISHQIEIRNFVKRGDRFNVVGESEGPLDLIEIFSLRL